ncbi:hypothetical protein [Streptomyces sp. NPDC002156]
MIASAPPEGAHLNLGFFEQAGTPAELAVAAANLTSRDKARAETIAARVGDGTRGLALDQARPETIRASLADVTEVDNLVITAVGQAANTLARFNITDAVTAVTMKVVGYAETVRVLRDRLNPGASVVLFGGLAKERPIRV